MATTSEKMTDNSDELSFNDLFVQSMQLQIPIFQREYKWSEKQLSRMFEEINAIIEEEDNNRFLGAIIAVKRNSNPSKPQAYEIVDGQQRLSTLYLIVVGTAYTLAQNNHTNDAVGIISKYLYNDWYEAGPNTKLLPSFNDRNQFSSVFNKLLQIRSLADRFQYRIKLPEKTGNESGGVTKQFERIRRKLANEYKNGGLDRLNEIVNIAITKLTYIFILLKDPSNATTVFHGLNDPGEPIGIGDLVRNEVFSYVYENPELAHTVYNSEWEPFSKKLEDFYDRYFFPYAVIHEPSIKTSDLFKGLRKIWGNKVEGPKDLIKELDKYSQPFLAIAANKIPDFYDKKVNTSLKKHILSGSPTSIYPFVTKLLYEYERENVLIYEVEGILNLLEAFLVRRALCGIEPTGLLSIFRFMWNNLKGEITTDKVKEVIISRSTIDWPSDERFKASIINRNLYGASICRYAILEYDKSLGGDFPENQFNNVELEHVLPQKLTSDWKSVFKDEDHHKFVHTWGNLIPLSSKMNKDISNSNYQIKKTIINSDSMYQSARRLAKDYTDWTAESILERSSLIGDWAVQRWPK